MHNEFTFMFTPRLQSPYRLSTRFMNSTSLRGRWKWQTNAFEEFNFFNSRTQPYQSQTCLRFYCNLRCLEKSFRRLSAKGGKGIKRARAMNEMQKICCFTPPHSHVCNAFESLWGEYNNCTILLRQYLWSSPVSSMPCI